MATSSRDYFADRPALRTSVSALAGSGSIAGILRSPKTPALGRSISSFGSPGPYRAEHEDVLVYELNSRFFAAGYAGESRPRCVLPFTPDGDRRVGDYRQYDPDYAIAKREFRMKQPWATGYELYTADLAEVDLGLVADRLDRALRVVHGEYLQLDAKPRRAALILPSLLPTPLIEVALKVLFGHFTAPPSVTVLTSPALAVVAAGVRDALVIDIGWEECVVTAVGEYKEVSSLRSVRATKLLTREIANTIETEVQNQSGVPPEASSKLTFEEAENLLQRIAWCQPQQGSGIDKLSDHKIRLPLQRAASSQISTIAISFSKLAEPAERTLFASHCKHNDHDDHDLPLHHLAHRVLLSLPTDLRALCLSRIIITGSMSEMPGLKRRLLQELTTLADSRGWDPVHTYGKSRSGPRTEANTNSTVLSHSDESGSTTPTIALSPLKAPLQDAIPHADRVHDDIKDPVTLKAERESKKNRAAVVKAEVRGVQSLGAWAGASLMLSMRIKGTHEFERDEFLKHGIRDLALVDL